MADLYGALFRGVLSRLDPERVHDATLRLLQAVGAIPPLGWAARALWGLPETPVEVLGLRFGNRIGIAAGFDKDGLGWRGLARLGVGHIEVGTVTPLPQSGNPRPRIFRLGEDRALINRMGFPGRGAAAVAARLQTARPRQTVLGVNIGKARDTPLEEAEADYLALLDVFTPMADYLAVNVSSPNTPGLRTLQSGERLGDLLSTLTARRDSLSPRRPLLVKLAPDLDDTALDRALEAALGAGIDGVVAANTTLDRPGLRSAQGAESGGLSGAPLTARSLAMVAAIVSRTAGALPVIACGGVMTPEDARARLDAGAALVQVYTGMVYRGPRLLRELAAATR